jgi:DME family drug/metabolite transporter
LLAGTAAVLFGLISIFGKLLVQYPGNNPVALMSVRAFLAFAVLAAGLLVFDREALRLAWRDVPFFLMFGLVGIAGCYSLYLLALQYISVTTAIVIVYTYPVQVAFLAALFLGERLSTGKLLALTLSVLGCFLVAEAYNMDALQGNMTGILLCLGASVSISMFNLIAKRVLGHYGSRRLTVYAFGFGALWMFVAASPGAVFSIQLPPAGWGILIAWVLFPTSRFSARSSWYPQSQWHACSWARTSQGCSCWVPRSSSRQLSC